MIKTLQKLTTAYVLDNGKLISHKQLMAARVGSKAGESTEIKDDKKTKGIDNFVEPPFSFEELSKLLIRNTTHYRATKAKASDAALRGWFLEAAPEVKNPSEKDFDLVNDFLKDPSPLGQSLESILENFIIDFEGIGNGALEIVKGIDGKPTQLNHISAKTIRRSRDFKVLKHRRGVKEIFYRQAGVKEKVNKNTGKIEEGVSFEDEANDMIYEIKYNIFSDFYGIPDIIPAMKAVLGDILQAEFNIAHFENGAIPAYMIIIEGAELDDNLEKLIEDFFKHEMKGPTAQGKTFILPIPIEGVTVKIERISPEVSEGSYKIYHELSIDEVLMADGVPPVRAFVTKAGSLGRDQAKEMNRIYKESVADPLQRRLERLINKWIIEAFKVTDWVFKLNRLSFDEREVASLAAERLSKTQALSKNEIRRFVSPMIPDGLDPVEGGDDLPGAPIAKRKHDHSDCITFKAVVDPTAPVPEEALSEWDGAKQAPIREVVAVLNPIVKTFEGRLRSAFASGETDIIRNLTAEAGGKVRVFLGGQKQIEINSVLKDFDGVEKNVETIMIEEADKAFESGATLGAQRINVVSDFALMRPEVTRYLDQIVTPFSEKISAGLSNRIRTQLAVGIQDGETLRELTKRVRTVFKSAKESRARLIARTESARAHNIGTVNQYKNSRVVKSIEVIDGSEFDLACRVANGQTWTLDTAKENPIEHPNCIRAFIPIVGGPGENL